MTAREAIKWIKKSVGEHAWFGEKEVAVLENLIEQHEKTVEFINALEEQTEQLKLLKSKTYANSRTDVCDECEEPAGSAELLDDTLKSIGYIIVEMDRIFIDLRAGLDRVGIKNRGIPDADS